MEELERIMERVPTEVRDCFEKVQAGLKFMKQDAADEAIAPGYGDEGVLVEAMVAQHLLLVAELISVHGLDAESIGKTISQQQMIILQLAHYLYAAGIQRGGDDGRR